MKNKDIIINVEDKPSGSKKATWVIPFNNIDSNGVFFYLKNTTENGIKLDKISISSTSKASMIKLMHATGDPDYRREQDASIINKELINRSIYPDIIAKFSYDINNLASLGQLDRIDMMQEITTYTMKPKIIISPTTAIVLVGKGQLSGVITISEE